MTETKYLKGFDYIEYLRRRLFLGEMEPWSKEDHGQPIMALLVSIRDALAECKYWSGQDIGPEEFSEYLKRNKIVTGSLDHTEVDQERLKLFGEPARPRLVGKLIVEYTAGLEQIADALCVSRRNIEKYDDKIGDTALVGGNGYIFVDETYWYVVPYARSKRHWTSITRQLAFLEMIRHGESSGEFRAKDLPTSEQANILRKVLGMKKRPDLAS